MTVHPYEIHVADDILDDLTCATPTHFIPIRLEQVAEAINGPMSAQRADPPRHRLDRLCDER